MISCLASSAINFPSISYKSIFFETINDESIALSNCFSLIILSLSILDKIQFLLCFVLSGAFIAFILEGDWAIAAIVAASARVRSKLLLLK